MDRRGSSTASGTTSFLDDFFLRPGAKPAAVTGREAKTATRRIATLISEHRPLAVAAVLQGLAPLVSEAVAQSEDHDTPWRTMRFPYWKSPQAQRQYAADLASLIHDVVGSC